MSWRYSQRNEGYNPPPNIGYNHPQASNIMHYNPPHPPNIRYNPPSNEGYNAPPHTHYNPVDIGGLPNDDIDGYPDDDGYSNDDGYSDDEYSEDPPTPEYSDDLDEYPNSDNRMDNFQSEDHMNLQFTVHNDLQHSPPQSRLSLQLQSGLTMPQMQPCFVEKCHFREKTRHRHQESHGEYHDPRSRPELEEPMPSPNPGYAAPRHSPYQMTNNSMSQEPHGSRDYYSSGDKRRFPDCDEPFTSVAKRRFQDPAYVNFNVESAKGPMKGKTFNQLKNLAWSTTAIKCITPENYSFGNLMLTEEQKMFIIGVLKSRETRCNQLPAKIGEAFPHLKHVPRDLLLRNVFGKRFSGFVSTIYRKNRKKGIFGNMIELAENRRKMNKKLIFHHTRYSESSDDDDDAGGGRPAQRGGIDEFEKIDRAQYNNTDFSKLKCTNEKHWSDKKGRHRQLQFHAGEHARTEARRLLEKGVHEDVLKEQIHRYFSWVRCYSANNIMTACFPSRHYRNEWITVRPAENGKRFFLHKQYSENAKCEIIRYIESSQPKMYSKMDPNCTERDADILTHTKGQNMWDVMISIWPEDIYERCRMFRKNGIHIVKHLRPILCDLIRYKHIAMKSPAANLTRSFAPKRLTEDQKLMLIGMLHGERAAEQLTRNLPSFYPELNGIDIETILADLFGDNYNDYIVCSMHPRRGVLMFTMKACYKNPDYKVRRPAGLQPGVTNEPVKTSARTRPSGGKRKRAMRARRKIKQERKKD